MNKKNISETSKEIQFSLLGLGARTRLKVLSRTFEKKVETVFFYERKDETLSIKIFLCNKFRYLTNSWYKKLRFLSVNVVHV